MVGIFPAAEKRQTSMLDIPLQLNSTSA